MYKPLLLAVAVAVLAPATASAATWSPPAQLSSHEESNPLAEPAFDGSVLTGWFEPTAGLSKRLGAPAPITAADPYEKVTASGLDAAGNAVVLTLRRHAPYQRVRAILVAADGTRSATRTISAPGRSASGAQLAVAADGTAVAGWVWHDPNGWRAQYAVRRPGEPRFDAPQTLSPSAPVTGRYQYRPFLHVAAGVGGRAAVTWQVGGDFALPEAPLHVFTAGPGGAFGADQPFDDAGGLADASLAISDAGEVQLAWLDEHFSGHGGSPKLHVAQGAAGTPLSAATVLATGGKGTSSGPQVATAFSADGTATVAWGKPGPHYEAGGTLEVYTRAPGAPFGPPQTLAAKVEGIVAAGGPGNTAALAWMTDEEPGGKVHWTVQAALRASGAFGAAQQISDDGRNALWPSVAITPKGETLAAWITNTSGGGSGQPTAAVGTP